MVVLPSLSLQQLHCIEGRLSAAFNTVFKITWVFSTKMFRHLGAFSQPLPVNVRLPEDLTTQVFLKNLSFAPWISHVNHNHLIPLWKKKKRKKERKKKTTYHSGIHKMVTCRLYTWLSLQRWWKDFAHFQENMKAFVRGLTFVIDKWTFSQLCSGEVTLKNILPSDSCMVSRRKEKKKFFQVMHSKYCPYI